MQDERSDGLGHALRAVLGLERLLRGAPGGAASGSGNAGMMTQLAGLLRSEDDLQGLVGDLCQQHPAGAMLVNASGRVVAITEPMARLFSLETGADVFSEDLDRDVQMAVRAAIRTLSSTLGRAAQIVPITSDGRSQLAAIEPYSGEGGLLLLVRLIGQPWHERLEARLAETFSLTETEVELVRGLYQGLKAREIAEGRGRSIDTVRTQLKQILRKTNAASQSELISTIAALSIEARSQLRGEGVRTVRLASGAEIAFREYGAQAGRPVLMIHASTDPAIGAERMAMFAAAGLRVIAPLPLENVAARDSAAFIARHVAAYRDLLAALGIARCIAAGHREGGIIAAHLAAAEQGRVAGVLAIDTTVPAREVPADLLPRGATTLFATARSHPFSSEVALRLIQRVMARGKTATDYVIELLHGDDTNAIAEFADPRLREIIIANYRFAYADCARLVQLVLLWYSDWSAAAESLRGRVPLRFLQGDRHFALPRVLAEDWCRGHEGASCRIVEGAGQSLLYRHTDVVVDEIGALASW